MADFGGTIDLYGSVTILAALAVITLTKGPQDKYYFSWDHGDFGHKSSLRADKLQGS